MTYRHILMCHYYEMFYNETFSSNNLIYGNKTADIIFTLTTNYANFQETLIYIILYHLYILRLMQQVQ